MFPYWYIYLNLRKRIRRKIIMKSKIDYAAVLEELNSDLKKNRRKTSL